MGQFYPIYARRSDGVSGKSRSREANEPTPDQLDQTPNNKGVSDYYRTVKPTEMKSLDWRRKLGGMLARELGHSNSSSDVGFILAVFPENYRLYEHVKKTEREGQTELKSKTHTAGGMDRQDAYLYGHPLGRKKRFRSPADFFPHLLWLCTDEAGDPDNCTCKICSPEELETALPASARAKIDKMVKAEPTPKPALKPTTPATQAPQQTQLQKQTSSVSTHQSTTSKLAPSTLPPPTSEDQKVDRQYNSFMYRAGEVVWFKRGTIWGLGIILRRWMTIPSQHHYIVQPLTDPFNHQSAEVKSASGDMRPWLAWSVPPFANEGLNNISHAFNFEDADWSGILKQRYGAGRLEQDGPILAAKTVDASYTLSGLNKTTEPEAGVTIKTYDSIFLGAEKVWAGDPVRTALGAGTDIAVVISIVERIQKSAMGQQIISQDVFLFADHYTLKNVNHNNPSVPTPAASSNNPQLPHRLTQDLAFRNERSIRTSQTASYWSLVARQQRLDLHQVKGRWYEASLMLPVLQPGLLEKPAQKGEILESGLWMNNRGDCQNANRPQNLPRLPKPNTRKDTRRAAVSNSVPPSTQIVDGIQPPTPSRPANIDPSLQHSVGGLGSSSSQAIPLDNDFEIDPRFDTAEDGPDNGDRQSSTNDAGSAGDGLDEFMNLDGPGDAQQASQPLPRLRQEYGSQSQGGDSYY